MESKSAAPVTTIPVHITQPEDHAPPTLAEPASGPVAEMSGALQGGEKPATDVEESAVEAPPTDGDASAKTAPVGESTEPAPVSATKPSEPAAIIEDTEMSDAAPKEPPATEPSTADINGEAAATKTNNGKRKSTGGVPEHKNKKLNKKKSMAKITHLDAEPGQFFYARLKSYPPWPSIICDESMLPTSLTTTRPVTTKKTDGSYNEAYADGGKKVADRTYPIMFLHTNEFAWIPNTDLQPIENLEEMANVSEKGKTKSLIAAHKVAAENHGLQHFKDMLLAHSEALAADEEAYKEAQAAKEAAKAAKKDKKPKRKSEVADDDVEMEDVDDDNKKSKKRKKAAESDDEEKPAKTTKLKLTSPKDPAASEKKKEKKEPKPKAEKRKSKAAVSDEDTPVEEKVPEKPLDPAEERKAREKEVLFLRHKLQKGFLSRDQAPQEEEMPQMSSYIKKLENYGDLEVSIIKVTKINKVLKALVKLNTIPKDEEFKFRERSIEMLTKWNKLLGNEPAEADEKKDEPATNGVHKDEKEKSEPAATSTATEIPVAETSTPAEMITEAEKKVEEPAGPSTTEAAQEPAIVEEPTKAEQEQPVPEAAKGDVAMNDEPAKADVTVAPESAAGAAEATELVKAME